MQLFFRMPAQPTLTAACRPLLPAGEPASGRPAPRHATGCDDARSERVGTERTSERMEPCAVGVGCGSSWALSAVGANMLGPCQTCWAALPCLCTTRAQLCICEHMSSTQPSSPPWRPLQIRCGAARAGAAPHPHAACHPGVGQQPGGARGGGTAGGPAAGLCVCLLVLHPLCILWAEQLARAWRILRKLSCVCQLC